MMENKTENMEMVLRNVPKVAGVPTLLRRIARIKKLVLIVEDEPELANVLKINLEKHDYQAMIVSDGNAALTSVFYTLPDLIVLDVMLPNINGFEVCRLLKANALLRQIPVVMLTALAEEEDQRRGLKSGADEYITKPFRMCDLVERIRGYLEEESGPLDE